MDCMNEFKNLLAVADRLLGPKGCPWDRAQTLFTVQPYLLEETHELIEAIDLGDSKKIMEELGDVLFILIFIAKLGEKNAHFTLEESIQTVKDKLIRRHPHVFEGAVVSSSDDVVAQWEEVKKKEGKKHPIDDIPPTLPAAARAQKVIQKMKRYKIAVFKEKMSTAPNLTEHGIAQELWDLIEKMEGIGIDAESALRRICAQYEEKFKKAGDGLMA